MPPDAAIAASSLGTLTSDTITALVEDARKIAIPAGTTIHHEGEIAPHLELGPFRAASDVGHVGDPPPKGSVPHGSILAALLDPREPSPPRTLADDDRHAPTL
jgi:hypothetical protein